MPYYSELGVYTPSSSYTSSLLKGPYSTHSSIIASNYLPPSSKQFRSNFRNFKPHLTTISETGIGRGPLRRINSPKLLYHSSPKVRIPRPVKINTADIDVSINRYTNKYPALSKPKVSNNNSKQEESSAKVDETEKSIAVVEKEAKPNREIRRDRTTIRLQTIHKDKLEKGIGEIKSWRDNFKPEELVTEAKSRKKTPGEILKDKFLIRSKSKENVAQLQPPKLTRRLSVKKSPSFKDICNEITSHEVVEDLNPGQPIEVRRRQSRQLSHDDVIKEIQRSSSALSVEEEQILDAFLEAENDVGLYDVAPEDPEPPKSLKKKKGIKKKSSGPIIEINNLLQEDNNSASFLIENKLDEKVSPSVAQQHIPTLKNSLSPTNNSEKNINKSFSKLRKDSSLIDMVKDISQVDIEMIPVKQKPVITGYVGSIDEKIANNLKPVVEDLIVVESPKPMKKEKKFRFNVTVQEFPTTKTINYPKHTLKNENFSKIQLSQAQKPILASILKKREAKYLGQVVEEIQEKPPPKNEIKKKLLKSLSEIHVRNKESNGVKKSESNENFHSNFTVTVNKSSINEDEDQRGSSKSSGKLKIVCIENNNVELKKSSDNILSNYNKNEDIPNEKPQIDAVSEQTSIFKSTKENLKIDTFLNKNDLGKKADVPPWALKKAIIIKDEKEIQTKTLQENKSPTNEIIKQDEENIKQTIEADKDSKNSEEKDKITDSAATVESKETINEENFWSKSSDEKYEPPKVSRLKLELKDPKKILEEIQECRNNKEDRCPESPEELEKRMMSKRSLIQKANKSDPDLEIFEPPSPTEPPLSQPTEESIPEPSFIPLQSNRLSQWMHPWKKPAQNDTQLEIYAKPKYIRARHIPRRWRNKDDVDGSDGCTTTDDEDNSDDESSSECESDEESEEEEEEEEEETAEQNKIGASTSSEDSGFESGRPKMKGSIDSRDSPVHSSANQTFNLDLSYPPEEVSQSSIYQSFQRSGRITPPATTIPRFRKYCVDDFNFLKVIGKGSFGKVLLAELKGTEYYYAIKCLKKDVVLEDDDVECTLIERKVLALGTKHPYLCHLLCTFQTESHLFFVMEYLNGGDLMFHIQAERRFSVDRARFYGAEIVSGLKFLHNKGIVYRDLKLDNILLDFDGHVRIADFGMCKLQIFLDRMADTFCGTPDYMAPEIIKGQHYNQCVDWWSFGVLLYEMLLGQSPFSGGDEDELFWSICNEKPVIPRFLSAEAGSVLLQFLEKDANKRLGNRFSPYGDIQDHPFFKPIDWTALESRQLESPCKPNLQHPLDTRYFDKTFTTEKAKITPIESSILQSMDQTQFQGFSYTNPNATDK